MKQFLILLALFAGGYSTFAQKAKANSDTSKTSTVIVTEYICPMHPDVTSDRAGKCSKCGMNLTLSKKEQLKREVVKLYTCPMHTEVVSNKAGTCPQCSAKLVVDRRGSKQATIVYTCPMHKDITSDKSGKCSKCNMDLTEKKDDHTNH